MGLLNPTANIDSKTVAIKTTVFTIDSIIGIDIFSPTVGTEFKSRVKGIRQRVQDEKGNLT